MLNENLKACRKLIPSISFCRGDLYGKSKSQTIGAAITGRVCSASYSLALIEEAYGYRSFFTLIHEVAHR